MPGFFILASIHLLRHAQGLDDEADITAQYQTLLERIRRYRVTEPAARARMLVQIEAIYRAELQATRSRTALFTPSTGNEGSPKF